MGRRYLEFSTIENQGYREDEIIQGPMHIEWQHAESCVPDLGLRGWVRSYDGSSIEPRPQHLSHRYLWRASRLLDTPHSSRCLSLPTSSSIPSTPLEFPYSTVAQVAPDQDCDT